MDKKTQTLILRGLYLALLLCFVLLFIQLDANDGVCDKLAFTEGCNWNFLKNLCECENNLTFEAKKQDIYEIYN
tara:strand:- start:87 stop:308 length:222 start_codon:yes stop_codon:yes gene_type:complete